MKKIYDYQAEIMASNDLKMDVAYVDFPFDVEKEFDKKKVKIRAFFNDVEYRGLLTPMGGQYALFLRKDIRAQMNKNVGDLINVRLEEDTEPRVVEVPPDLSEALIEHELQTFFDKMSYTHQKEYVNWINGAKRLETRQNRLVKAIQMMKKGIKGV